MYRVSVAPPKANETVAIAAGIVLGLVFAFKAKTALTGRLNAGTMEVFGPPARQTLSVSRWVSIFFFSFFLFSFLFFFFLFYPADPGISVGASSELKKGLPFSGRMFGVRLGCSPNFFVDTISPLLAPGVSRRRSQRQCLSISLTSKRNFGSFVLKFCRFKC